jgi:putative ABC transport system ATP-binding protein
MALALNRGQKWGVKRSLTGGMKEQFQEALKTLDMGLERRLDHPIGLLSGGQRQAVSLVMAVLSPLSILILDEHTAALDPKTAAMIIAQTTALVEKKKLTTLMVTHSMHQALEVGTRTLMLHKGSIVHDFSSSERAALTSSDLLKLFEEMDA